jgi:hypothetical protein
MTLIETQLYGGPDGIPAAFGVRLLGAAADDAVFLDVTSLKPGDRWKDEIESAVRNAAVFVLCWCCESQQSAFVAHEIETALIDSVKRLVPVLFCGTPLPEPLSDRQWIDLRGKVVHFCNDSAHPRKSKRIESVANLVSEMISVLTRLLLPTLSRRSIYLMFSLICCALATVLIVRGLQAGYQSVVVGGIAFLIVILLIVLIAKVVAHVQSYRTFVGSRGHEYTVADEIAHIATAYFTSLAENGTQDAGTRT